MNDIERAIEMMNEILRRKMNSPASYVLQASPYTTDEDRPIIEAIHALEVTAQRHVQEAVQRILALEGVPSGGSYESSIADTNYLSIRYLIGQLIARLEQDIRIVEQYRDRTPVLEAKDFFSMVLEDDTAHRDRLLQLKREVDERQPMPTTHVH